MSNSPSSSVPVELTRALSDLADLAWHGVPGCDGASVSLLQGDEPSTLASSHDDVRSVDDAQYENDAGPCLTAMREARVVAVEDFSREDRWPELTDKAAAAGVRSSLSLPLSDGERVLGGLNMYARTEAAFTEASQHAADSFARQAMMLLRTLQQQHSERTVHAHERRIATTLQRALLPSIPGLPGIRTAARYLPAASGAEVGGDWYDVMPLPDGAIGVAIGDVVGHDVLAAAAMGQLRSVLRSYAFEGSSSGAVLDRLDRLIQGFDMAQAATAFFGRLTLIDGGGAVLTFANAGHPPPLLRRPDGSVEQITTGRSPLLGALPSDHTRREAALHLPSGSTLVLYTDGLVETRERPIHAGIDALVTSTAALPQDATPIELCDHLSAEFSSDTPRDDIALLVIRIN